MMREALEQYSEYSKVSPHPQETNTLSMNGKAHAASSPQTHTPMSMETMVVPVVVGSAGGSGYDNIKMRYLRSLNIPIPSKKPSEDENDADGILATSAPIDIPNHSFGAKRPGGPLRDDDSDDLSYLDDDSAEYDVTPTAARPIGRRRGNTSPKGVARNFIPPHQLTTNTGGSGVINHSLPSNYRRRHQMGI